MRAEISALHRKVGKTFIYVTHDQVEALTMATRIIVINNGVVQQIDAPQAIYDEPANTFVARFVGAPPMNLVPVSHQAGRVSVASGLAWDHDGGVPDAPRLLFGIRPEKLQFGAAGGGPISAQVAMVERLGAETIVGCRLISGNGSGTSRLLEHDLVLATIPGSPKIDIDERCSLDYRAADVVWFDESTGARIPTR